VNRLLRSLVALAVVVASLGVSAPAIAAPGDPVSASGREPVMLIVDTSGSMGDDDGTGMAKIDGARAALLDLLNVLPVDSDLGLRTYPAASGSGCGPGELAFEPGPRAPKDMAAEVNALSAAGDTPTAEALEAAGADLRAVGYTSATLVLVSDGMSTCGDPCPVARDLAASGLAVTVNTVGFRIDQDGAEELRCIATATGGTYTDVTDSDGLGETLATLNGAELGVELHHPVNYSPAVSASLDIEVEISNVSSVEALDVRASIVFDPAASGGSPTVLRPVRVLGNVAGGATTSATWQVFPSTVRDSGTLEFAVTVTRSGGDPVVGAGKVKLGGQLNVAAGGELVANAGHVVILGDSYSSGEGAAVGAPEGHAYQQGKCHRSSYTYAEQLFAGSDAEVTNIACSGAVMNDYEAEQSDRDVERQRDQLEDLDDVDLMFLTIGGNDLNFSSIIKNCLLGFDCTANVVTCGLEVVSEASFCTDAMTSNPLLWQNQLGNLRPQLVAHYRKILADSATLGGDGGAPPLVVLPYVNVLPASGLAIGCQQGFPMLSQREMALVRWLQDELNSQIAQAVAEVRQGDSRIYYADDVVHAVEPDHTLCGEKRWINGILERGAGGPLEAETQQELIHPNAFGYSAEAAAVLRWSRTVTEPEPGDVRDSRPLLYRVGGSVIDTGAGVLDWAVEGASDLWHDVQDIDLQLPDVVPVVPGLSYRVTGAGFAPGETAVVSVMSTPRALATAVADENGEITAEVQVPEDLPSGSHTLVASGFTPDGTMQVIGRPIDVSTPSLAGPITVGAAAFLLLLAGGLLVVVGLRRRRAGIAMRDDRVVDATP
jgi:hypothetical protein